MTEYYQDSVPAPVLFWLKPVSIFGLSAHHDVYQEFTCVQSIPCIQPCLRLMLAETPSQNLTHEYVQCDAVKRLLDTLSKGCVRVGNLPAHPRRRLLDATAGLVRTTRQTITLATSGRSDTLSVHVLHDPSRILYS